MQSLREVRRPSVPVRDPEPLPTEYESFFALVRQGLGERLCQLIQEACPPQSAAPASFLLSDFTEDDQRKLRIIAASDAMRFCIQHSYGREPMCSPNNTFELWPARSTSRPQVADEETYLAVCDTLHGAMGIINLVHGHMLGAANGYYAHAPKGLTVGDSEELLQLMSVRVWRKALEKHYKGMYLGFQAPDRIAAAKTRDNSYLREFLSLKRQADIGLFLSDP